MDPGKRTSFKRLFVSFLGAFSLLFGVSFVVVPVASAADNSFAWTNYEAPWASPNRILNYTGAEKTLVFQLPDGITDKNIGSSGWQTLVAGGIPGCTPTGMVYFQVDVEAVEGNAPDGNTRQWHYDQLVAQGGMNLGNTHAKAIELRYHVVKPPKCKPEQPAPEVKPMSDTSQDCDFFYEYHWTVTTPPRWDEATHSWLPDTANAKTSDKEKKQIRPTTPEEKKALKCEFPAKPDDIVTETKLQSEDCYAIYLTTVTTTIGWVKDEPKWQWVQGEPVVVKGKPVKVRDKTEAEQAANPKCVKKDTQTVTGTEKCVGPWTQIKTTVIIGDKPQEPTYSEREYTHKYTDDELIILGCQDKPAVVAPVKPSNAPPLPTAMPGTGAGTDFATDWWMDASVPQRIVSCAFLSIMMIAGGSVVNGRRRRGVVPSI